MGNKEGKPGKKGSNTGANIKHTGMASKADPVVNKPMELTESDYTFLISQSGL